jgi:hypothetical protein
LEAEKEEEEDEKDEDEEEEFVVLGGELDLDPRNSKLGQLIILFFLPVTSCGCSDFFTPRIIEIMLRLGPELKSVVRFMFNGSVSVLEKRFK